MDAGPIIAQAAVPVLPVMLTPQFVGEWNGRLLNIHPSLLPAFKGLNIHERVINAGVRITGCTVHFVSADMDAGPIIAQAAVPVLPDDTPERLAARVLTAEHSLYPAALQFVATGAARLEGGSVVYTPGHFEHLGDSLLFAPQSPRFSCHEKAK